MSTQLNIPNLAQISKDHTKVGEAIAAVQANANQKATSLVTAGSPTGISTPTQRPG